MENKQIILLCTFFALQLMPFSEIYGQDKHSLSIQDLESRFAATPTTESATALNRAYIKSATVAYKRKQNDSLQLFLNKCQETWQRVMPQNEQTQAQGFVDIGSFYIILKSFALADSFLTIANDYAIKCDDEEFKCVVQMKLSKVYMARGLMQKAAEMLYPWQDKIESFTDIEVKKRAYMTLGEFYQFYDTPEKMALAMSSFKRCLAVLEEALPPNHPSLLGPLGSIYNTYCHNEQFDSAQIVMKRIIALLPQLDVFQQVWVLTVNGSFNVNTHDLPKAKEFINRSWALVEANNMQESDDGQFTLHLFGRVAMAEGRYGEAEDYLKRSLAICKKIDFKRGLHNNLTELVKLTEKQGKYQEASRYQKELSELNEYRAKENYDKDIANMEVQLNVAQKDRTLIEQKSAQRQLWIGVFFLGLVLTLSFWFYGRLSKQGRVLAANNVLLADKNDLIDRQNKELTHLDVAKMRFFANVSHELRTPLTLILGPLNAMLKNDSLNNAALTHAHLAQVNAQHLLKLVNEILDLSKLESGKMKIQETTVRFQPFIRRLVSAFESHAEHLGIHYRLEYNAAQRLRLDLDAEKMTQVVNNLLSNALKFTPRGGSVFVKIEDLSNVLRLTVSDTGRGIHPEDLPNVFERFYQTNQADAAIEGGTGIGLALCRELADIMGGRIWVESEWGKGSTFFVEFPKKEVFGVGNDAPGIGNVEENEIRKTAIAPRFKNMPNTAAGASTGTILVVEDNRDLRSYVADILRGANYQVLETENGREALDLLQDLSAINQMPQLILSDIMMPVMDGFQLLKVLKDTPVFQQIPVVMLTARADIREKLTALRIGVDDYLLKPFDEEELLVRIENLLKNKANRRSAVAEESMADESVAHLEGVPHLSLSQPDREWLESFETYVRLHLADDTQSVSALALHFTMSESTLLRHSKRLTGLSPVQYVQEMRLDEARRLLENRSYDSIAKVASKVGYEDARSFSRSFRQRFGKLPSEMMGE